MVYDTWHVLTHIIWKFVDRRIIQTNIVVVVFLHSLDNTILQSYRCCSDPLPLKSRRNIKIPWLQHVVTDFYSNPSRTDINRFKVKSTTTLP